MKKFLIISQSKKESGSVKVLFDYIKGKGHEIQFANLNDLTIVMCEKGYRVYFEDKDITKTDIIIFRNSKTVIEKVDSLYKIFKSKGAKVFGYDNTSPFSYRKFTKHFKFRDFFPKTIYFTRDNKEIIFKLLDKTLMDFPFILKPEGGSRGVGVELISNKEDFYDYFKKIEDCNDFILQEYLDIEKEYRVFVLGKEALGCCEKLSDGLTKNFAQGSKFKFSRDVELEKLAENIALGINHHTLGFDMVRLKDNSIKIIEINTWAHFVGFQGASKINMAEKIYNYYLNY